METIVDQLDTVNSNSFLKEIKNPENIKDLIIKNYNKDTEWSDLDKFINLEKLQLNNCLIENKSFFLDIQLIFLTAWVIIIPDSKLYEKWFKDLPKRSF